MDDSQLRRSSSTAVILPTIEPHDGDDFTIGQPRNLIAQGEDGDEESSENEQHQSSVHESESVSNTNSNILLTPISSHSPAPPSHGRGSLSPLTHRQKYNASPDPFHAAESAQVPGQIDDLANRLDEVDLMDDSADEAFRSLGLAVPTDEEDEDMDYDLTRQIGAETLPKARFHTHRFQDTLKTVRNMLKQLRSTIELSPVSKRQGSHLSELLQKTNDLSLWESSATQRIALVGDAGSGKSSLINALLGKKDLAVSGSAGSACTCVITEYRYQQQRQSAPFGLEVEYMSKREVKEMVERHLRMYQMRHGVAYQHVDIRDREEQQKIDIAAELALDTFSAIFRNIEEFSEEFLQSTSEEVLPSLQRWAESARMLLPGNEDGLWSDTASRKDECRQKLKDYTSDPLDPSKPALWPFIHVVRVFLRSEILKNGVILADLPGLRDVNQARLEATENYVYRSDEIFAIAEIGRAVTNEGVEDVVRRFGSSKPVRIICTKSEDVRPKEEENVCYGTDKDRIRELRNKQRQMQQKVSTIDGKLRAKGLEPGQKVLHEVAKTKNRDKLEKIKFELKKKVMETRNARVTQNLAAKYEERIMEKRLKVFCVSNKDYFDHQNLQSEYSEEYLDLSGIAEVRRWCLSIVAEANFHAACSYLTDVKACLSSLKLWHSAGSGDMKLDTLRQLQSLLDEMERNLINGVVDRSSALGILEDQMNRDVRQVSVFMRERGDQWMIYSVAASKTWERLAYNTYQAFCRRWGIFQPRGRDLRNWNEELTKEVINELNPVWAKLMKGVDEHRTRATKIVETLISEADNRIKEFGRAKGDVVFDSLRLIMETMRYRTDQFTDVIESKFDLMSSDIRDAMRKTQCAGFSSYICQAMITAYDRCLEERGRDVRNRMFKIMEQHFTHSDVHESMRFQIKDELKTCVQSHFKNIRAKLMDRVKEISRDFDEIRKQEVKESSEDLVFTESLGIALAGASEEMKSCLDIVEEVRNEPFQDGYVEV